MIELYPQIRAVHILAISLSGLVMAVRYAGALAGQRWPRHIVARGLAWTIDGTILTVAAMLVTILPGVASSSWLLTKLVFVVLYFGAGYYGLAARQGPGKRALCAAVTAMSFALAYGIARAHDPLGWFS